MGELSHKPTSGHGLVAPTRSLCETEDKVHSPQNLLPTIVSETCHCGLPGLTRTLPVPPKLHSFSVNPWSHSRCPKQLTKPCSNV